MSKNKKVIVVILVMFILAIIGNIYLSTWLHLTLKQEFTGANQLGIAKCLHSLMTEHAHRILYGTMLLVIIAVCTALILMERGKEDFSSDLTKITENISTPVAIGQGQHGTAKWQKKAELAKVFCSAEIYPADQQYQQLMEHGYDDLPKDLHIEKNSLNSIEVNKL